MNIYSIVPILFLLLALFSCDNLGKGNDHESGADHSGLITNVTSLSKRDSLMRQYLLARKFISPIVSDTLQIILFIDGFDCSDCAEKAWVIIETIDSTLRVSKRDVPVTTFARNIDSKKMIHQTNKSKIKVVNAEQYPDLFSQIGEVDTPLVLVTNREGQTLECYFIRTNTSREILLKVIFDLLVVA
jgi:hypothetical protein